MNAKIISAILLFLLTCAMEIGAVIEYFHFPAVQPLHMGLAFALLAGVLLVCSVKLYRSGKKS